MFFFSSKYTGKRKVDRKRLRNDCSVALEKEKKKERNKNILSFVFVPA